MFVLSAALALFCQSQQQAIPRSFFGIHVNNPQVGGESSYPVQVPYGQFRARDVSLGQWPDLEPCPATYNPADPCYHWGTLDGELLSLASAIPSVTNVEFTLSRTPPWAVTAQQQGDSSCRYWFSDESKYQGACYPPTDIDSTQGNGDGAGSNQIWRNWVAAIAVHAKNLGTNYAHVKYWEIWNEFNAFKNTGPRTVSWAGTPSELIRMTQDAACIITGRAAPVRQSDNAIRRFHVLTASGRNGDFSLPRLCSRQDPRGSCRHVGGGDKKPHPRLGQGWGESF